MNDQCLEWKKKRFKTIKRTISMFNNNDLPFCESHKSYSCIHRIGRCLKCRKTTCENFKSMYKSICSSCIEYIKCVACKKTLDNLRSCHCTECNKQVCADCMVCCYICNIYRCINCCEEQDLVSATKKKIYYCRNCVRIFYFYERCKRYAFFLCVWYLTLISGRYKDEVNVIGVLVLF